MSSCTDFLLVESMLTEEERQGFLERAYRENPGWVGAEVADILCELEDEDAHLGITEPVWEALPNAGPVDPGLVGLALLYATGTVPSARAVERFLRRRLR